MRDRTLPTTGGPLFVGIAGGSGSGKTTIAEAVVERLQGGAVVIQHDAYYRHTPDLPWGLRSRANYDHPKSLETELLAHHLRALRAGEPIERPVYDFAAHLRSPEVVRVDPAPVVLLEGILVLASPELRSELDLKIFVDTDADVRLARRLQRDIHERGRTPDSVIDQYFATVRPMHMQFVEPSKQYADLVVRQGNSDGAVAAVVELIGARSR